MSNLSKAAINTRYDALVKQLEAGTISKANFKASADRLYKLYHGKANKAARNSTSQPSAKAKAAGTKPVNTKPKTSPGKSPVQQAVAANKPRTAKQAFYQEGKRYGGPPISGKKSNIVTEETRMGDHFALSKNKKSNSKKPAFKVIKGVLHVLRGGKYVPTKKSR